MLKKTINSFALIFAIVNVAGCIVSQPRGYGEESYLRVNGTPYSYWLYLPEDYEDGEILSAIISLHGLKPFDSAHGQCREWQHQADKYRFAIVSPELASPSIFSPLPLNKVTSDLERDGNAIVHILQDTHNQSWFNPDAVLLTSWSYGGYVAHWVANQYPELFTCLAVRQSNFNKDILDPRNLVKYKYNNIGIFTTSNDFNICKKESEQALRWYRKYGFIVTFDILKDRGHERIPSVVADFFIKNTETLNETE